MARQFIPKLAAYRLRCLSGWQTQEAQRALRDGDPHQASTQADDGAEGDVLLQGRLNCGQIGVDRTRQNAVRV